MTDVSALLREVSVDLAVKEESLLVQKKPSNPQINFLSDMNRGRQCLDLEMNPRPTLVPEERPQINDRSPAKSPAVF